MILRKRAEFFAYNVIHCPKKQLWRHLRNYFRKFLIIQDYMLENGVTAYSDKALGVMSIADEPPVRETMEALDELYGEGKMKVRL